MAARPPRKPDWAKIEAEYLRGGVTLAQLARKHGVSKRTMERHASAGGWGGVRGEVAESVERQLPAVVAASILSSVAEIAADELEAWTAHLAEIRALELKNGADAKARGEALAGGFSGRRLALGLPVPTAAASTQPPIPAGGPADGAAGGAPVADLDAAELAQLYRTSARPPGAG